MPPGATDLTGATNIAFSELGVGDRILAIGRVHSDQKSIDARSVIAMTQSDLAQKQQRERDDWQKRGTSGTIAAIDSNGNSFTMKSGARSVTVEASGKTEFRRYAPDSVKISDARPSSLAEIRIGDQVRVLGDRTADGTSIKAERILSGSFRQVAVTVNSVNVAANEVVVRDLATKKTLTVHVTSDSTMRRLPPAMSAMLARRYQPSGGRGEGRGGRNQAQEPVSGGSGTASSENTGGNDIGQILEKLPAMTLSELKPGDALMLSTTTGADPQNVTAVMVLAGVEPLLTASPTATNDIMSGWNLGNTGGSQ